MKKTIAVLISFMAIFNAVQAAKYVRPVLRCGGEPAYFRIRPSRVEDFNCTPREMTSVKVDIDAENLYLYFDMVDDDTFSEAQMDQTRLNSFGDALQLFFKAEKETGLWEFFISPNGKKSCFFHLGAGMMFYPAAGSKFPDFSVCNTVKDGKWQAKVTIPKALFKEKNIDFDSNQWKFMFVRHNRSRYATEGEISCYPQSQRLSNPDFFGTFETKK